jgi:hypothetical protein
MADLVERLGGAIVSPHSQSGIHLLHMIRVLKERGELNLVKAIIIPESAIGLGNLVNAGITPQDFDHIPFLLMNGDYRTAAARNGNRTMIAAINAAQHAQSDRQPMLTSTIPRSEVSSWARRT